MNLATTVELQGYGTSEGVKKEWDSRGRAVHRVEKTADGFQVYHRDTPLGKPFKRRKDAEQQATWNAMRDIQFGPLNAYGTSEGVEKSWDTRGRRAKGLQNKPSDKPGHQQSRYDAEHARLIDLRNKLNAKINKDVGYTDTAARMSHPLFSKLQEVSNQLHDHEAARPGVHQSERKLADKTLREAIRESKGKD